MSNHNTSSQHDHEHEHEAVERQFLTPGTLILIIIMTIGYGYALVRMLTGIGTVTNLDTTHPWGIWIAIDVASGVALAAGGFTVAALVNIFGRKQYEALERPALLTAWLGYSFVGAGLLFDLGRYYNIWHPAIYWQGNSVLFEVGICVMTYLTVLTVEFMPTLLAGIAKHIDERSWWTKPLLRFEKGIAKLRVFVRKILPIFVIAGVVLSFMHQSSLGSLMLIAPTKVSPLWWTPILPVLFLLSAIMVGFPVVIFESISAAKAFRRPPEMELLAPLSRIIPFILAIYGTVKLVDLFVRNDLSVFTLNAGHTIAWLLEFGIGVVIPFILLVQKQVRESQRWLFIAVAMIIAGVVLNRLNVFLVGYSVVHGGSYFPAVGEIAITAALISTIIFLYRFFANFFPVLPGHQRGPDEEEQRIREHVRKSGVGLWGWVARAFVVLLLLGFIDIYTYIHSQAAEQTKRNFSAVKRKATPASRPAATSQPTKKLSFEKERMPSLIMIDRAQANDKTNDYKKVRFSHKSHAIFVKGDCAACHHRVIDDKNKTGRIGVIVDRSKLKDLHPTSCVTCHQKANEPDAPNRPGLKAAYHRQCIGCHQKSKSAHAPTTCNGACHRKHTPDHSKLVKLEKGETLEKGPQVTKKCLECHNKQGKDLLDTIHWTWRGSSPNTTNQAHRVDLGKTKVANNFCIHTGSNMSRCAQCHVGYGWTDTTFNHRDPKHIDCLVCHDQSGTYKKNISGGGIVKKGVDLLKVATSVGTPSRKNCGTCHFYGGGGANVKHGDLEPELVKPDAKFDVHMGKLDMNCQTCHTTKNHRIAGQSTSIPASEGRVECTQCHAKKPHQFNPVLGKHLDAHTESLACQTCHIPTFAKKAPTKMFWDWSQAGKKLEATKDEYGMPTFHPKKGVFRWGKNVRPVYEWYNGTHKRHLVGDKLADSGITTLNQPLGAFNDPKAKISPFKLYQAIQPIDAKTRTLVIPKLFKGFWDHLDWKRAISDGMKEVDRPFSGEYGFAKTQMLIAINHEIVPANKALRCADCHSEKAVTCKRCHKNSGEDQFHALDDGPCRQCHGRSEKKWMDFKALGYKDDPALVGGRNRFFPLPQLPTKPEKAKKDAKDKKEELPDQYQEGLY